MIGGSLLAVIALLGVVSVGAAARPAASAKRTCHVPRLRGLTLEVALRKAEHAGCKLRLKGAAVKQALVQTVRRQSPAAGRRSRRVKVWVNPLCSGSADYGSGIKEPVIKAGPTELVSGFYLAGGPLRQFSDPHCKRPEPPPGAGTVEVVDASGAVVATRTSSSGHFVKIRLPAGSYTIRGTFLGATRNVGPINDEGHPQETKSIVIPAGHTVRQDFVLPIK